MYRGQVILTRWPFGVNRVQLCRVKCRTHVAGTPLSDLRGTRTPSHLPFLRMWLGKRNRVRMLTVCLTHSKFR